VSQVGFRELGTKKRGCGRAVKRQGFRAKAVLDRRGDVTEAVRGLRSPLLRVATHQLLDGLKKGKGERETFGLLKYAVRHVYLPFSVFLVALGCYAHDSSTGRAIRCSVTSAGSPS